MIFHSKKGDGHGRFGCCDEIAIIYRQLGNSSLGDKGEMEEGWGLRSGKMLRRDSRIWSSAQRMWRDCGRFGFTKCRTKQKKDLLYCKMLKHVVNKGGIGLYLSKYQSGLNLS